MSAEAEGALRVYYIPQVPMKAYTVPAPDLPIGARILDALIGLSVFEFENHVKPDYSDMAGIERWESDGEDGFAWYEIEPDEYEEWKS